MHGCKYACRYRNTHFCKYSTHSLSPSHTHTHKGLLCWTGQALLTCFSSLHCADRSSLMLRDSRAAKQRLKLMDFCFFRLVVLLIVLETKSPQCISSRDANHFWLQQRRCHVNVEFRCFRPRHCVYRFWCVNDHSCCVIQIAEI